MSVDSKVDGLVNRFEFGEDDRDVTVQQIYST